MRLTQGSVLRWATLVVAFGLSVPTSGARAQSTAVVRRPPAATTTLSRARIDQVLGGPAAGTRAGTRAGTTVGTAGAAAATASTPAIRVVRPTGVVELPRDSAVRIAPGEFVFRKTADTARRVAARTPIHLPPSTTPGSTPSPPPPPSPTLLPAAAARENATTYAVPYRWLTVDSAGVERVLVPYFILDGGGLTYDVASRSYRGIALIGVEDTLHPGEGPVALPRALQLQLTATSGGTISPRALAIGHTSLVYDSVRIVSADSTAVRIQTGADREGIVVPIPVRAISVGMEPAQRSLPGLGLAATEIAVTLPRGMTRADTAAIVLSATRTPVHPRTVVVTGAAPSTVRLRSGLPGRDSIFALLDNVPVGATYVDFEPPWTFAGATIAGLLLGGFARFFGAKRRKRVRALGWDMLRGAPFGVIAAAASAVGLDLLQLRIDDPGTWIAIMLTAAIGAWVGSRLLDRGGVAPAPPAPAP